MRVLAIVVSYNFMRWIDRCLPSLMQQEGVCPDILVVDNGSSDGTCDHIRKHYPQVRLVENRCNLGFGRANNTGMEIAVDEGYDGVLLLNQDAWIDGDCLGKLVRASAGHPQCGILSPVQMAGDRKRLEHGFSIYIGKASAGDIPKDGEAVEVPFVNAAIWYLPIATVKAVGLFAPLFHHYGEDRDYANRARYHHLATAYVPCAYGCHDRDGRQVTRPGFRRSEYVYHLSEYANINYGFARAFAFGVLATVKKAFISLVKGRWRNLLMYLGITVTLIGRSGAVIRTRKDSRRTGT